LLFFYLQTIMGVAQNCSTIYWAETPTGNELDWILEVLNKPTAPWVFSISYGSSETGLTQDYFDRIYAKN
jgi:hypothetical protein